VPILLAFILMARSGARRGVELMPWPDGLEYAAAAVNLDHGLGPVLHFGGYSYPSRYPEGYPLILAAGYLVTGPEIARLYCVTIAFGLLAIAALYALTMRLFGRPSAMIAALILATSPIFLTYSTLVLSDVPTLSVTILAALALARTVPAEADSNPNERGSASASGSSRLIQAWAAFGLLAGFTVMIRPTNAAMLAGVALAMLATRPAGATFERGGRGPGRIALAMAAFAAAFAIPVLILIRENLVTFGSAFASGYAFWVPEVYGSFRHTFSLGYLFGPTMPRNPHGNVLIYLTALGGVDGLLGDQGDPRYFLYPFAAAAFAAIGIVFALREQDGNREARRVLWFGLGFLAALVAIYFLYVFTEVAFILPATFVIFTAAGYGVVAGNRWAMQTLTIASLGEPLKRAAAVAIFLLDLMLAVSTGAELSVRLAANPSASRMVPALTEAAARIEPDATVVSNVSLQFLELYVPGRKFIGLNSFDPNEHFTDYHLHRLYVKRDMGYRGAIPPVVFDATSIAQTTIDSLAAAITAKQPVYLLLCAPESPEYADVLKTEVDQLGAKFPLTSVVQNSALALFRFTSH
jgi:4-amino-4-deoxy-L-arabinose transferase-like glycosyltransferase